MLENTLENKGIFFAEYWHQAVMRSSLWRKSSNVPSLPVQFEFVTETKYLELKSFSLITNQDAIKIGRSVGLANAEVVGRDKECVMVVDDSYSIGLFATGVITMYKGLGLNLKPYWQDLNKLYTVAKSLGYYVGDGKEIKYGWVKIIDHETIQAK